MNEQLQSIIDGLYDALPETIAAIGDMLDGDPQVVQLRQEGKTERTRIRADEDIARARIRRNTQTALDFIKEEIKYLEEMENDAITEGMVEVTDTLRSFRHLQNMLE